jgi:hypothetical protein
MARKKQCRRQEDPRVSKYGWYVAIEIERYDHYWQDSSNPRRRCMVEENIRLIQARSPNEAYKKALAIGRSADGLERVDLDKRRRKGVWRFVGLANLLPVYEKIEDGCEILCIEHYCTAMTAQKMVRQKRELVAFRRSPE